MPKTLDKFPAAGGQARYPWDEWLNGQVWELRQGEDYNAKSATFLQNARSQGDKRGGRIRTRQFTDETPERVVIQFHRPA